MNKHIVKKKQVYNITPFTLLDFPSHVACIVWLCGCGMRCGYCYNTDIVTGSGNYSYDEVLEFLETRKGLLQGVVLCGGEPLFGYDNSMLSFIVKVKNMGFMVKLDTNGVHYENLQELLDMGLLDFVALDFKAPKDKFELVTQNPSHYFEFFINSVIMLIKSGINFEIRTTIHPDLLDTYDIQMMIKTLEDIGYNGTYYLQNFLESKENFGNLTKKPSSVDLKNFHTDKFKIEYRNFN
jgi:pyruvate formate lyase activating enzyme